MSQDHRTGFKTMSEAEVLVAFPAAPSAIIGDMTLHDIIRLILHLMYCAQAVKNDNHALNYLYLAYPDTFWANYSADAYPTTSAHPGNLWESGMGMAAQGPRRSRYNGQSIGTSFSIPPPARQKEGV